MRTCELSWKAGQPILDMHKSVVCFTINKSCMTVAVYVKMKVSGQRSQLLSKNLAEKLCSYGIAVRSIYLAACQVVCSNYIAAISLNSLIVLQKLVYIQKLEVMYVGSTRCL